ncbi:MAG: YcaO-like family protein [Halobacteriales archaeon]
MSDAAAVGVVGSGPAVEAIEAAIVGSDYEFKQLGIEALDSVTLAVVAVPADDDRLARANAVRTDPWLAVELGGIGGRALPDLEGALSLLAGSGPCYQCLTTRVASALEEPPEGRCTISGPDARFLGAQVGRLALRWLEGEATLGTVIEQPHAERRLLPVPGCDCDVERVRGVDRSHESVSLETTVERAEGAVDGRLGPVASIGEAESFPAPYYLASVVDTTGFSDVQASRQAAGVAAEWNPAFMKAIGEALERYSAGVYRPSSFRTAPASDLPSAVPPDQFVRPDEGFEDPDPDAQIDWVAGEALSTGEQVHLPAARAQFPPPAERFGPAITTGLGLGTDGTGALVAGLTEVIERDATMLGWYSTFEPLGLTVDDPGFDQLARRARAESLEVTALLLTQDVDVPVVGVAVHREGEWPQFAVGSDAALDPVAASRGALEEALQNWMELRGMGPDGAAEEDPALARYADFPPVVQGFLAVEDAVPAASVGPADPPTGPAAVSALVEALSDVELDAYAARLTTRDVAALGFEVVRVLVPGAQPLFTGDRFFGERARTVPRELGFRPRLDRPRHPYP